MRLSERLEAIRKSVELPASVHFALGIAVGDAKELEAKKAPKKSPAKSPDKLPPKSMQELIGTDDSSPYWDFWGLMKVWPKGSNQQPRKAAEAFVAAVDGGTYGGHILEAATALLATTPYACRLDQWLTSEGYVGIPMLPPTHLSVMEESCPF